MDPALNNTSFVSDVTLSFDVDIVEDVSAELEDFIFLSRLGLFQEARQLFDQNLEPHLEFFPVVAEYADMLLNEGNFRDLLQFLDKALSRRLYDEDHQLLALTKALSEAYIEQQSRDAKQGQVVAYPKLQNALKATRNWQRGVAESMNALSEVQMQTLEICLSIEVLAASASSAPHYQDHNLQSSVGDAQWEVFVNQCLRLNFKKRFWEAQRIFTLLAPELSVPRVETFFQEYLVSLRAFRERTTASTMAELAATNSFVSRISEEMCYNNRLGMVQVSELVDRSSAAKSLLQYLFQQMDHRGLFMNKKIGKDSEVAQWSGRRFEEWKVNDKRLRKLSPRSVPQPSGTAVNTRIDSIGHRTPLSLTSITKVVSNTAGMVHKVATDLFSSAAKVLTDIMSTANKIVLGSGLTNFKVHDTLATVHQIMSRALSSRAADVFLKYTTDVFAAAGNTAVVDAILQVIHRSLEAMIQSLSGAMLIWRGIFTNGTSEESLSFILNHLYDLLWFLYDLVKPANVILGYPAVIDTIERRVDKFSGRGNPYNEFDLQLEQNRQAIIFQMQRVALTLTAILKTGRERVLPSGLGNLTINASIPSDFDENDNPPPPTYVSRLQGGRESPPDEKWLFINGIANEFVWFQRSCDKIRDTFKREVKGIYNRSDGILWDLIECCGEHSAAKDQSNELIERTQSSKAAQNSLQWELSNALWPVDRIAPDKVIIIAHSQGCLLLRLVLQELVEKGAKGSQEIGDMKERLRVFTFANPSLDWRATSGTKEPLNKYVYATEHFAHQVDFVAMLGVVTHRDDRDTGYDSDSVFYSKDGRGHLFGAHYPLEADAYANGERSQLMRAVYGRQIA